MDETKFGNIMIGLAENFGADLTKQFIDLWYDMLTEDGYSLEQIQIGARKIVRERKYKGMPTYAEFVKAIAGKVGIESRAIVQADNLISHLNQYGASRLPLINDPITEHLMLYRWPYLPWACNVKESEIVWWKKEFVEAYQAHRETETLEIGAPKKVKELIGGIG